MGPEARIRSTSRSSVPCMSGRVREAISPLRRCGERKVGWRRASGHAGSAALLARRIPERLRELLVPPLPRLAELLELVRTGRREVFCLADVFRQVVKLGAGEVTEHGRIPIDERALAGLHELPFPFANRHHAAKPPIEGLV